MGDVATDLPVNRFKQALRAGRPQVGLWNALPGSYVAEILAGAGFDWLLLDTEHAPSDPIAVLPQLQALAAYPVSAVVRPASNDTVLIKRFLDVGAQTLLVPYVQTVAEAEAAVAAVRYPPAGVRGIATATRAGRFGRVARYTARADAEICLIVQAETADTLDRIEAIAAVDGIDGIFIGPADLAATLGHPGEPGHPAVVAAVEDAIRRIVAAGKPAGILATDPAFARRCMALGTTFTAVGIDAGLLARATERLAADFRG
jgi:4-hydroxy-2-oxoheptanedioate aldolase